MTTHPIRFLPRPFSRSWAAKSGAGDYFARAELDKRGVNLRSLRV
jgi:hypothetical protein